MSERTAPAIAKIDVLLPKLRELGGEHRDRILQDAEALRRAVGAFHMEAIRFRMHSVERLMKLSAADAQAMQAFDEVRHALETAGFHTRSHSAP
jgi:hypothetical protein